MKNEKKIKAAVIIISAFMLAGCAQMVMTEKSYVVEKPAVVTEENKPVINMDPNDINFTGYDARITLGSPSVYLIPNFSKGLRESGSSGGYPAATTSKAFTIDGQSLTLTGYAQDISYHVDWHDRWVCVWYFPPIFVNFPYTTTYYSYYYSYPEYITITKRTQTIENDEGYIAPRVMKMSDGTYKMWATRHKKVYDTSSITSLKQGYTLYKDEYESVIFNSANGETWTEDTSSEAEAYVYTFNESINEKDAGGRVITNLLKTKASGQTIYIALYLSRKAAGSWNIYSAYTSKEFKDWKRSSSDDLYSALEISSATFDNVNLGPSSILEDATDYKMWYTGEGKKKSMIGFATSNSGYTNWSKSPQNPVYKGTAGRFDEMGVMDPCVIKDGDIYKMYYVGYDSANYHLGLAYSMDGVSYQYYNTADYNYIKSFGDDVRYPYILEDTESDGTPILRMYYCKRETVNTGTYVDMNSVIQTTSTKIWTIHTAKLVKN